MLELIQGRRVLGLAAFFLSICGSACADIISVDIGVADGEKLSVTPNEVEAGFEDFSFESPFDGIPGVYDFVNVGISTQSRTYGPITTRLRGTANGISAYDFATDVDHPQGDLVEDVIRVIQGDIILTLEGLTAGQYEMTTYHHFATEDQDALKFGIYVNDGNGEVLKATDVSTSYGYSPTEISTETFRFKADGTNDIVVRFDGGGSGANLINPVLNGFELTAVPEPEYCLLVLAALMGILGRNFATSRWNAEAK